jgi:hypothetical protein
MLTNVMPLQTKNLNQIIILKKLAAAAISEARVVEPQRGARLTREFETCELRRA